MDLVLRAAWKGSPSAKAKAKRHEKSGDKRHVTRGVRTRRRDPSQLYLVRSRFGLPAAWNQPRVLLLYSCLKTTESLGLVRFFSRPIMHPRMHASPFSRHIYVQITIYVPNGSRQWWHVVCLGDYTSPGSTVTDGDVVLDSVPDWLTVHVIPCNKGTSMLYLTTSRSVIAGGGTWSA